MKETLIILGAGVMQGPAITIAKELGFYTIALDGSKDAPCISLADRFEQIDLKDKSGIENFARSLLQNCSKLGIMTAGTDFSASVAWAAERLGLPGIPYEAALNASDKGRMRACFKNAALPSPEFFTITNADEDISLEFPLVIKPVDNMGSRGCRRVDSIEEFRAAAKEALGFSRSGRAIAESFMEGPEFSVDAIVYNDEITICGLADRHIFFPPYFIEMGHTMPAIIEAEKQRQMLETFCAGVRALGLTGKGNIGAAKGDIKLTEKGPMIGEIAARLSGGYMSGWTYPYSSGVLPIRAAILAAMGKKPDGLIPVKNWTCAERAFISIPGTVKEITGAEKAQKTPFVNDVFMRITKGSKVAFPENNVTKCGNIIAAAQDRAAAINAAETAARSILLRLDPADLETKEFLAKGSHGGTEARREKNCSLLTAHCSFPPDAFQLTSELKAALAEFPETNFPQKDLTQRHEGTKGNAQSSNNAQNSVPPCLCAIKNSRKIQIIEFPDFVSSGLTDYMGRTIEENLEAVRKLTGFPLLLTPECTDNKNTQASGRCLGRSFWAAFIRGAYQGAVYYIDNLGVK